MKELKKRPCPVVFASFSGGPKACMYKALQVNTFSMCTYRYYFVTGQLPYKQTLSFRIYHFGGGFHCGCLDFGLLFETEILIGLCYFGHYLSIFLTRN